MTYGGFQRLSEASAYSKMKREQREDDAQGRKEVLDKCEVASQKIDEGDTEAAEELYQALEEFGNLVKSQEERKRE